jgi:hypothetical protein
MPFANARTLLRPDNPVERTARAAAVSHSSSLRRVTKRRTSVSAIAWIIS